MLFGIEAAEDVFGPHSHFGFFLSTGLIHVVHVVRPMGQGVSNSKWSGKNIHCYMHACYCVNIHTHTRIDRIALGSSQDYRVSFHILSYTD